MLAPRLKAAASDPQLRGAPLAVLLHEWDRLDEQVYTPIKVIRLAFELHLKEVTVGWALRRLVDAGYLERGPRDQRVRTYRRVHIDEAGAARPPAADVA